MLWPLTFSSQVDPENIILIFLIEQTPIDKYSDRAVTYGMYCMDF